MSQRVLNPDFAALVIIDIQEAFRPSISGLAKVIAKTAAAGRGFEALGLPVLVTEQYPKGLGATVDEISDSLTKAVYIEKSRFSACGAGGFVDRLAELKIKDVAVAGIEAHVCVNQTVHGLLDEGFRVHVLEDAVDSRSESDRKTALAKMRLSGAVPSTVEMALFELLVDSKSPRFKEIQNLIK